MTGMLEAPGIGHNQPDPGAEKKNQQWERWAKKRTFVRALEGTYSHLYKTAAGRAARLLLEGRAVEGRPGNVRQAA